MAVVPEIPIYQPLHGLKKERCATDRSKIPSSAIGNSTGFRYKHYLNLTPHGWYVASRQTGTHGKF